MGPPTTGMSEDDDDLLMPNQPWHLHVHPVEQSSANSLHAQQTETHFGTIWLASELSLFSVSISPIASSDSWNLSQSFSALFRYSA